MLALSYILLTSMKNYILELRHKPSKLILYLICIIGMVVATLPQLLSVPTQNAVHMDIIWLKGAYFAIVSMLVIIAVQKGLSNGDTLFDMQDVNLLFVSPLSSKSILMYGLIQMFKSAFWAGFFILFMSNPMYELFGKGFSSILILFFSFMIVIVLLSIVSLVLYSLTNGRPKRKLYAKFLTLALFVPIVTVFVLKILEAGQIMAALHHTLSSPVFSWTPIVGWSAESAVAFVDGTIGIGLLFASMVIATGIALLTYIWLGKIDYYEDVLVATETSFEKKRAIAEGQSNPEALLLGKTKVSKTGISGTGPSTFFYKHLRESTRASALGFFSITTIITILTAGAVAFFMRNENDTSLLVLQVLMWMQIFMIGTGRGLKETMTHYIYLLPSPSFQKIVWSNMEPVFRVLLESLLLFGLVGVLGGESPLIVVSCITTFTLFSLMLIGINYLSMRWFGAELGVGILLIIYMLTVAILLSPGLIAGVLVGIAIGGINGTVAGLGILSLWELLVALTSFWLSKSVLHNCDMITTNK